MADAPQKSQTDREDGLTLGDRDNMLWFWRTYLRKHTVWVVAILIMTALQGLVYQQFLRLTENGLRVIFERGELADLVRVCLAVGGIFAFRGIISYIIPRAAATLPWSAINHMRRDMTAHVIRLDLAYFESKSPGKLLQQLAGFTGQIGEFIGGPLIKSIRDIFTIVIVSGWLLYQQPLLFGTALCVIPVMFLAIQILSRRVKSLAEEGVKLGEAYLTSIDEMFTGIRTIKITNQEASEEARIRRVGDQMRGNAIKSARVQALTLPALDFASAFVYMLVIGAGGYMVISPDYDVDSASIITFLLGLVLVFDPSRRFAQFFVALRAILVSLDEVRSVFLAEARIFDAPGATDAFDQESDITFDKVSFAYSKEQPLFDGLDLTFEGGKTTAIVGPTGSGKTTVLSLLARLYLADGGDIRFGDQSVSGIKLEALRNALSVVAQDIVIFNASIYDNIAYVRPDATEAEVRAAAEAAELSDLIAQRGDVPVGPKGTQLSGGQRQRIAIARALLRDAPVVILDEATSALDQRTEERVQDALGRLSKGRTTITVAHRLSSVSAADKIYVLEAGKVVEAGNHAELMAAKGLYASLYQAQSDGYEKTP